MLRAKVGDITKIADCNHHFVRRFADVGYIKFARDINSWRIFPNPSEAVETIRYMLGIDQLDTKVSRASVNDSGQEGQRSVLDEIRQIDIVGHISRYADLHQEGQHWRGPLAKPRRPLK